MTPKHFDICNGLHWAYGQAEGWTLINVFELDERRMVRFIEYGPSEILTLKTARERFAIDQAPVRPPVSPAAVEAFFRISLKRCVICAKILELPDHEQCTDCENAAYRAMEERRTAAGIPNPAEEYTGEGLSQMPITLRNDSKA